MRIIGVIPARYNSSRYPGKPLADINGKSMIERVYKQVKKCKLLSDVIVATDHQIIFDEVISFGGKVEMTSEHNSGTERCNELVQKIKGDFDILINIQGDVPYINPKQIHQIANIFTCKETKIGTLVKKIETIDELLDENIVKVIVDNNYALDFSRLTETNINNINTDSFFIDNTFYKHIGIYGYRVNVLEEICKLKQTPREKKEKLEQLRWLENSYEIKVSETMLESKSVDVPKDIEKLNL